MRLKFRCTQVDPTPPGQPLAFTAYFRADLAAPENEILGYDGTMVLQPTEPNLFQAGQDYMIDVTPAKEP